MSRPVLVPRHQRRTLAYADSTVLGDHGAVKGKCLLLRRREILLLVMIRTPA
jgi:hypothetical protein